MIPLKLSLRNFMCYRENVTPLDFSGIRLACLSGDNGHGKTALLDAITWALWSRSRAKTEDELIYLGADEMEVEFAFLLGDNQYRVIRKRQRRKGASLASLEFQIWDGTAYRPITGNSVSDTERRIASTLRMDYETFINSAYLLQGRADEFTVKPPGERKRILADILGLSLYDELEELAKEQARAYELERRTLEADIRTIDAELTHEPRYKEEHAAAQSESARLSQALRAAEEVLRSLLEQKRDLDAKAGQLKEAEVRCARTEREIADIEQQLAARRQRIVEYEVILAQRASIEEGYAALQAARESNEALNRLLARISQLQDEERQVERVVDTERNRLLSDQQLLGQRSGELTARAAQGAAREGELAAVRATLGDLDALDERLEVARQRVQEHTNKVAALRQANSVLKEAMKDLRAKLDALAGVSHCPLCNSALSDEHRETVRRRYEDDGKCKGDEYRRNDAEIKGLEQQTARMRAEMAELETRLRERPGLQRREAALAHAVADGKAAAEEVTATQARLAEVTQRLEKGDFAQSEQARLAAIRQQIAGLGYDPVAHETVRSRLAELGHFDGEKSRLETAAHLVESERATTQQQESSLTTRRQDLKADRERAEILRAEVTALAGVAERLRSQQKAVEELEGEERAAREALGAARQKLEHCAYLHKQRKEKVAAEATARDERTIYEELAVAFGRKGIQAMIIEQAIPEIEEEANALLARMTDNRMHVRFETLRDTKKGDTIETLDIKIADELGTRNYEMYSGGESFRANFAIRIALSKLLARRAGARLQTLVIDEGFGTQDSRGRERLVEAIHSIAQDFQMILVITHVEELKDAFPVRIEVTKTTEGSQVMVM